MSVCVCEFCVCVCVFVCEYQSNEFKSESLAFTLSSKSEDVPQISRLIVFMLCTHFYLFVLFYICAFFLFLFFFI